MNSHPVVVLAEDQYGLRRGYTARLKREGFTVRPVENAEKLIEAAAYDDIDVLVVDARLPTEALEGIEAVGDLLRNGRIPARVPVIFISVHAKTDIQCERKLQAYPHLTEDRYTWLQKHFELEQFVNTIRKQLELRRAL